MYAKVLFKNIVLYILKYVARAQSKALLRDFLANRPNPDKPEPNGLENKEIDHEGTEDLLSCFHDRVSGFLPEKIRILELTL